VWGADGGEGQGQQSTNWGRKAGPGKNDHDRLGIERGLQKNSKRDERTPETGEEEGLGGKKTEDRGTRWDSDRKIFRFRRESPLLAQGAGEGGQWVLRGLFQK